MDRVTLRDAINQLQSITKSKYNSSFAYAQAVYQFNALLAKSKSLYPDRTDIQAIQEYTSPSLVEKEEFENVVTRLISAIELRPLGSSGETLSQISLPEDAPADVKLDMTELKGAIALELHKTALLLAGSIAESLLLERHPDKSEKGPGLRQLVEQSRKERLFGRDTLRYLENLIDYRDLIHPRAEKRNKTLRNEGRVTAAVTALKLLCHELEDVSVRYEHI